jgi:cell division protein FtsB
VLGAVLLSYFNPLRDFAHSYRAAEDGKARLAALQVENDHLERRVKASRDPGVLEREARRQGMVMPGERAYVIKGLR